MQGWTEKEIRNRDLMAPCGIYRGACGVYIATRDGNEKFKRIMANRYGTKPEETEFSDVCSLIRPEGATLGAIYARLGTA